MTDTTRRRPVPPAAPDSYELWCDLLEDVVAHLAAAGVPATMEYPGFLMIEHARPGLWWAFGTVNGRWQGQATDVDGHDAGQTVETGIAGDEPDPATIAAGIARALTFDGGSING